MRQSGNIYSIVILLMALKLVHIIHPPSLFGLSAVGATHGIELSFIKPLSNKSYTCLYISSCYFGFMWYASLLGRLSPRIRSI